MHPIYEADPNCTSPLMKWGINVSKMRRKAFDSYRKDYDDALFKWPEFRQEYDYCLSMKPEAKSARNIKGIRMSSFLSGKNFLKYLLPPNKTKLKGNIWKIFSLPHRLKNTV